MKMILVALAIVMLFGLQGCATVTKGTKDTVQVQVSNCSEPMDCTATNKKGSWNFTAPGSVRFKKSDKDLTITCNDGGEAITQKLSPTRGGMIWGNVLIGGVIGVGLDAITDAHWNMSDSLILHRNNCGKDNLTTSSPKVQPSSPEVQPSSPKVQPSSQEVQPSSPKVQPSSREVQPSSPKVQPSSPKVQPSSPKVQPSSQEVQPSSPKVQPSSQEVQPSSPKVQPSSQEVQPSSPKVQPSSPKVQGNKATRKPNYIIAPRPSWLKAVHARDKGDCEFITSITRNVGGGGDVSNYVKIAKDSALTEAVNMGANSYFIVNAESSSSGAAVTLEALKCK